MSWDRLFITNIFIGYIQRLRFVTIAQEFYLETRGPPRYILALPFNKICHIIFFFVTMFFLYLSKLIITYFQRWISVSFSRIALLFITTKYSGSYLLLNCVCCIINLFYLQSNYDTRLCGLCPNAQSRMEDHRQQHLQCPADSSGRLLCWDDRHCQKKGI